MSLVMSEPPIEPGIVLTEEQRRRRRARSIAIALALGAFVLLVYPSRSSSLDRAC